MQQDLIKKLQDTSNMLQQLLESHEQEVAAMERSGQANVSWTRERLEVIDQLELKSLGLEKAMEGGSGLLKSEDIAQGRRNVESYLRRVLQLRLQVICMQQTPLPFRDSQVLTGLP